MTALRFRLLLGLFCLAGAGAACTPTIDQRGNLPDEEKLATIRPGITSKETVAQVLGTPSSTSTFDDKTWYYISKRTEQVAFFEPTLLDQQVVVIDFDDSNLVADIRRMGMADRRDVTPVARATPAPGKEMTIMEQLLGNVGRFNTPTNTGRGREDTTGNTGPGT
jgi:outer membrane protein assembly factor BamE (lipoprotein component of BamABCDE complex)